MAEKLTCSAPTTSARPGSRCPARYTRRCSSPVVITPGGRSPGTRRAVRGRSRQPVASSTARAATVSIPAELVSATLHWSVPGAPPPGGDPPPGVPSQPVTVVPSRMSAPAAAAASAYRRAYAGPASTRRRSRAPNPVCWLCRGMPPAASSRSATSTAPAPSRRSSTAAASPAGPAPTMSTSVPARGGDPPEPPAAPRPRSSVTGPWAVLARVGTPPVMPETPRPVTGQPRLRRVP